MKKNIEKQAVAERFLQLACEACIDIAELVIIDQRFPTPTTAKEAIQILGEKNILDKTFTESLSRIAGFRNILVHDYIKIDYEKVADKLNNRLEDFNTFAKQIAQFLI